MSVECSMEARECIEDLLYQFAYDTDNGCLCTGGLSALEYAFEFVGWENPHPLPKEMLCQAECNKRATCGTPTPDGYKRLCYQHYEEVQPRNKEEQ